MDPYYLTCKAEAIGYHPQIILAGRRLNDSIGACVASQLVKEMLQRRLHVSGARVLVMGLTFKENCPDLRKTRVVDVRRELEEYGVQVDVHDPWADPSEAEAEYGLKLLSEVPAGAYDGIIIAVAHSEFRVLSAETIRDFGKKAHVLYDLKSILAPSEADLCL